MKERPILFSGEMVRAILEGRKTQTRRVVKPLPSWQVHSVCKPDGAADPWAVWFHYPETDRVGHLRECPYGKPGNRLWVRETWASGYQNGCWGTIFAADKTFVQGKRAHAKGPHFHAKEIGEHVRWKPSIHLHRWASRILLEITDVRVQRLHDIKADDAIAEGVEKLAEFPCITPYRNYGVKQPAGAHNFSTPQASFMSLWMMINGADSYNANPWVWALTFKRVEVQYA